ncbi:MAG: ATP-dependent DNA helicase RecG [Legionellales bacterium]|nr:ATP-dependent DNA helicase RecG [Legionellales bacterium]
METTELLSIIDKGEDSFHQFKEIVTRAESIAQEFVAFSNSGGGFLFIGVSDEGKVCGLTREKVGVINQLISNAATNSVRPPINPKTENIGLPDGIVMVITVEPGISKPYMDHQGNIWVKNGADKRKVTAREELQRIYQAATLVHADELPVSGTNVNDLDRDYFADFFEKITGEELDKQDISLPKLLENMNLMCNGELNICCTLLFAQRPQLKLPIFIIKAVSFPGNDITEQTYIDSQDIVGKMSETFQRAMSFILSNIRHKQGNKSVNSIGDPEIPRIVFEELLANALIHRDYFVSAPIRLLVFANRIEIISPGHLPNNLTVNNIKLGNSNIRNPILASFATRLLPYRGLGSGVLRALKAWPDIDFSDDREGNQFKVIIHRDTEG